VIRPLPGRVVIQEDKARSSIILDPGRFDERAVTSHRGKVLAAEPFVFPNGAIVPLDFEIGDTVIFHFTATEKGRTVDWGEHAGVVVMHQQEVDAVLE
jgi:co-chaperonin GroES (HSP10)